MTFMFLTGDSWPTYRVKRIKQLSVQVLSEMCNHLDRILAVPFTYLWFSNSYLFP